MPKRSLPNSATAAAVVAVACSLLEVAVVAGELEEDLQGRGGAAPRRQQDAEAVEAWMDQGKDDATWVLTSSFVILTMQSGFGALESGSVDKKFEVNVMMKNVVDVVFCGMAYWMVGYGISYGASYNGFIGTTNFFVNMSPSIDELASSDSVEVYSHYIFQLTFAATSTTIVSGCVAGRMKFITYMLFSFVNTIVYGFVCHWAWNGEGWLLSMGYHDFAGDGPVHLLGAVNGMVSAWLIGPRVGRWDPERQGEFGMQNPMNCILGTFMLWWGWLGFNCGSTFGITGLKWLAASRIAVTTINASIGGALVGIAITSWRTKGAVEVNAVVNGILSGLVAITAGCAAMTPLEALLVGGLGAAMAEATSKALVRWQILDDPVGAVGVHGTAGIWGLLAVGLFSQSSLIAGPERDGLFHGGGLELLGVQALGIATTISWAFVSSNVIFRVLNRIVGLRADPLTEEQGFDSAEHNFSPLVDCGLPDVPAMANRIEELTAHLSHMSSAFEALQTKVANLSRESPGKNTLETVREIEPHPKRRQVVVGRHCL
mmetsp:Transcript_56305/g.174697  ORF Transcript_56305/g.174697 Transcript_56305/m.174697 type:complete len:544 (+) Transcript_56305:17-1648(+)